MHTHKGKILLGSLLTVAAFASGLKRQFIEEAWATVLIKANLREAKQDASQPPQLSKDAENENPVPGQNIPPAPASAAVGTNTPTPVTSSGIAPVPTTTSLPPLPSTPGQAGGAAAVGRALADLIPSTGQTPALNNPGNVINIPHVARTESTTGLEQDDDEDSELIEDEEVDDEEELDETEEEDEDTADSELDDVENDEESDDAVAASAAGSVQN